jgi:hypothetical protein
VLWITESRWRNTEGETSTLLDTLQPPEEWAEIRKRAQACEHRRAGLLGG